MARLCLTPLLTAGLCLSAVPLAAAGGYQTARDLAAAIVTHLPAQAHPCPETLASSLGPDLDAVCASTKGGLRSVKSALEKALKGPEFGRYPWLAVSKWESVGGPRVRIAYWLGASSVEVVFDKKSSEVIFVTSKPYEKCGSEIPFRPALFGKEGTPVPARLFPTGYPLRAATDRIDGTVAMEVEEADGQPSIKCIHHASPAGYGFEFHAIEAVHETGAIILEQRPASLEHSTVIVSFSKASERRAPIGAKYH